VSSLRQLIVATRQSSA